MTWEYVLIGLLVGMIIGAVLMHYGNRKLRKQILFQCELRKSKAKFDKYREEVAIHFADSAKLLDNIADDYRNLYQHMAKCSNSLLPDQSNENNPFRYQLIRTKTDIDYNPSEIQPRDYPERQII